MTIQMRLSCVFGQRRYFANTINYLFSILRDRETSILTAEPSCMQKNTHDSSWQISFAWETTYRSLSHPDSASDLAAAGKGIEVGSSPFLRISVHVFAVLRTRSTVTFVALSLIHLLWGSSLIYPSVNKWVFHFTLWYADTNVSLNSPGTRESRNGLTHPRHLCSSLFDFKKDLTPFPAQTYSPSVFFHHPPLTWCLKRSSPASDSAMSWLGEWWFDSTLHILKMAFQHSNISVEYRIAGPCWRISSIRWTKTCNFGFSMIRRGSIEAQISSTLLIRISRSA